METINVENRNENEKSKKKYKISKIITIIIISIVLVPLGIMSLMYSTNKKFKNNANKILRKMPGVVGEHFRNYPTELEKDEKIIYLSKHYIDLDPNVAADKMYIIKKDDEKLYIDVLKEMNNISNSKTEEIVLKVRNMELRKDLLFSIYEEAQEEEMEQFRLEVSRIEKQDTLASLLEIEKKFADRDFLKVLSEVKTDKLGEVLYYIDSDVRNYILNTFEESKKTSIEVIINEKTNEVNTLIDLAKVYETKPLDVTIETIGNTNSYSLNKLAVIYSHLSALKSAELLAGIKDENFIEDLFSAIIREEQLTKSETNITSNVSKTMEFLNEYSSKVNDLVVIYEKMAPDKVAKIVEKMMQNTNTITSLEISSEKVYELSDRTIIVDVLSKMKNQTLSKVLDYMESDKASQITRLLAQPKN